MTAEERKQIADTILEQLGGGRFILMTGAKDFSFGEAGDLRFRLTLGRWRVVRIELTPMDVYRVTFIQPPRRGSAATGRSHVVEDVYAEDLRRVFERETGLATSLGPAL